MSVLCRVFLTQELLGFLSLGFGFRLLLLYTVLVKGVSFRFIHLYKYLFLIAADNPVSISRAVAAPSSDRGASEQLGMSNPCSINCLNGIPCLVKGDIASSRRSFRLATVSLPRVSA